MNSNFSVVLVSWIDLNTLFMAIKIQQKLFKINYFKENKKNFGSYEIKQTLPSSQTRILLRSSEIPSGIRQKTFTRSIYRSVLPE